MITEGGTVARIGVWDGVVRWDGMSPCALRYREVLVRVGGVLGESVE